MNTSGDLKFKGKKEHATFIKNIGIKKPSVRRVFAMKECDRQGQLLIHIPLPVLQFDAILCPLS